MLRKVRSCTFQGAMAMGPDRPLAREQLELELVREVVLARRRLDKPGTGRADLRRRTDGPPVRAGDRGQGRANPGTVCRRRERGPRAIRAARCVRIWPAIMSGPAGSGSTPSLVCAHRTGPAKTARRAAVRGASRSAQVVRKCRQFRSIASPSRTRSRRTVAPPPTSCDRCRHGHHQRDGVAEASSSRETAHAPGDSCRHRYHLVVAAAVPARSRPRNATRSNRNA